MKVLREHGEIPLYRIVLYEEESPALKCLGCAKIIPPSTHGLLTIIPNVGAHAWCFDCGVKRLAEEPELRTYLKRKGPVKGGKPRGRKKSDNVPKQP